MTILFYTKTKENLRGTLMKKPLILSIAISCLMLGGCAELMNLIPPVVTGDSAPLSTDEVIGGLREALRVGAQNAVLTASRQDGFYGDSQLFIPFPPEAARVKQTLMDAGFTSIVTDFERAINRAAEDASRRALPIFRNAIMGITFTDAMGILRGPDNAATMYLQSRTEADLQAEFAPVVNDAIRTVDVTRYWNPVATTYNSVTLLTGGSQVNPNLEEYITGKTLDGLFLLIAQEEQKIRRDPAARVTEVLKRVFGAE